jgi:hypothetical protein
MCARVKCKLASLLLFFNYWNLFSLIVVNLSNTQQYARCLLDTGLDKDLLSKTEIGESVSEFKGIKELSLRKYHRIFLVLIYLNQMKMALEENLDAEIENLFTGCAALSEDVTMETNTGSDAGGTNQVPF